MNDNHDDSAEGMRRNPSLPPNLFSLLTAMMAMAALFLGCRPQGYSAPNPEQQWQLYDVAWNCGFRDRLTPLAPDWKRYRQKLIPFKELAEREVIFEAGYDDGFAQHPEEQRDADEMDYDGGYRSGRLDAWRHKPASTSDGAVRAKGYADGFNGRRHEFHRPY